MGKLLPCNTFFSGKFPGIGTMKLKTFRSWIVDYFLAIFTLPRVREEISRLAKAFMGQANRYSSGFKNEAIETKDAFIILTKYIKREKITREERKQFKLQVFDILKGTGVVVPAMLIPLPFVGTLLLVIMDHILLSMNIKLLPSSFYPEEKKEVLTKDGIIRDFERVKKKKPAENNRPSRKGSPAK
jgi:hypothetical protein